MPDLHTRCDVYRSCVSMTLLGAPIAQRRIQLGTGSKACSQHRRTGLFGGQWMRLAGERGECLSHLADIATVIDAHTRHELTLYSSPTLY